MTLRIEVDSLSPELLGWLQQQFTKLESLIMTVKQDIDAQLADIKTTEDAEATALGTLAAASQQVATDIALLLDKIQNMPAGAATAADLAAWAADLTALKAKQTANAAAIAAALSTLQAADTSANPPAPTPAP